VTGSNGYGDYYINLLAANKALAAFDSPSSTILLGEGGSDSAASGNDGCGGTGGSASGGIGGAATSCTSSFTGKPAIVKSTGSGTKVNTAIRHLDGSNFAFADGHVKWYKGSDDGAVSATATLSSVMSGSTAPGNVPSFKIASPSL
jgi:prepilin-type processing-associated H-X9-DG protein